MPAAPRRGAGPAEEPPLVPLATALSAFLRSSGLDAARKQPRLEAVWRQIVGPEFAERTCVLGVRKGVVQIGVASSALMSEIRFHQAALLDDLRRAVRRPAISGITFTVAPMQEDDDGSNR